MTEAAGALLDVRVLDVGGAMTAYCAKLLCELGADVVVVEPPGGEELRRSPPWLGSCPGPEASLLFAHYRAGTRSVTLDPTSPDAVGRLASLAAPADVVLISPTLRHRLVGWDVDGHHLCWGHPDLVVCAITHHGLTGPHADRRATPQVSEAASGAMYRFGPPEGPPRALPGRQAWDETGAYAAFAVLAALRARGAVGGQLIDVSVHETIASHDQQVDIFGIDATVWHRTRLTGIPPAGVWQCRDGPINISSHQLRHWGAFLDLIGRPAELADPLYEDPSMRQQLFDLLGDLIRPIMAERSRFELFERGQELGLPCAVVHTPTEFLSDPQVVARGFDQRARWAGLEVHLPASAFGVESSLTRPRQTVPTLGSADDEIEAAALAPAGRAPAPLTGGGPSTAGALSGLRVLSLGTFIAGNVVNHVLAHLGADVVKVESWLRPEPIRSPPYTNGLAATEPSGASTTALFAVHASGSRPITLDMNRHDARSLFRRLAAEADVVVENFGVGLMERWGCGFEHLTAFNRRLVVLSISGYGRTGPRSSYRAYASALSSFVGLHHELGQPHITHHDYVAAVHGAVGVLAALHQVERTGTGVHVDIAQIEAGGALMAPTYLAAMNGVPDLQTASPLLGTFRAGGADDWVVVELEDDADVATLAALLDRRDLATDPDRRPELEHALAEWVGAHSAHGAVQVLQGSGLAAAVVQHGEDLSRDPQLRERGAIITLHHRDLGSFESMAQGYRFSATPVQRPVGAARMGECTSDVLQEWLRLAPAEIDELHAAGVVKLP